MERSASPLKKEDGLLAKNTLINILGQGIPLLFAAAAIPFVIDGLGTERFGILTIVWVVIGYFGLFDMGISRATTKFVADMEARGSSNVTPFILTSIGLLVILGTVVSLIIYLITPWIVYDILNVPNELIHETIEGFYILSISIPFVLGSVGARGALEARQRFALVNTIKIPASIINYISPLLVLPFTNRLQSVVLILLGARICTFIIYTYFSLDKRFFMNLGDAPVIVWVKKLVGFGAWIMVSNFISPIMVYLDRFILGAILTMSAVAYYTTPYELVTKLLIISGSFMGVMFPAFSVQNLKGEDSVVMLHQKAIRFILLAMVPILIFLSVAAYPLLYLWLGTEFAVNSSVVLRLLAAGVLINSVSLVPYTVVQAIGRPDITAKLHMIELPIYLGLIWYLTYNVGIEGVATAWLVRVALDGMLLLYFSNKFIGFFHWSRKQIFTRSATVLSICLIGVLIFFQIENMYGILAYAVACALAAFLSIWKYLLQPADRVQIFNLFNKLKGELKGRLIS